MQVLTEYYKLDVNPIRLSESYKPGERMIIRDVIIQRANSKNRNGRVYPEGVLRKEIEDYNNNMVKQNRALGELDHSDSNVVNLKNVSHNILKIYWKGDDVCGDIEILDGEEFPAGRIAAGLLRRGIPVGISSRGMGSVSESLDGSVTVNDDFKLLTFDLVSFESTQGANLTLKEGYDFKQSYTTIDTIIKDLICNNTGVCHC